MTSKHRLSADDFWAAYPAEKQAFDSDYLLLSYMARWAFRPSRWLLRLGVGANQVTYASYLAIALGSTLLAIGSRPYAVLGVLMMFLYLLLDCVDGIIARHTGQGSAYGAFLDTLGAHLAVLALWVGTAVGQMLQPDPWNLRFSGLIGESWITVFGLCAVSLALLSDLAAYVCEHEYPLEKPEETNGGERISEPPIGRGRRVYVALLYARKNVTSLGGIVLPLVLLASYFRFTSVLLFAYFWIYLVDVLLQIIRYAWRCSKGNARN